jgi:hypothetical protein
MKLLFSEQILNQTAYRELVNGTQKGLLVRWAGTNQAAQAVTLAQLGQARVNFRGADTVNDTVSFFAAMNNLFYGVAEFSSAVGGAFAATIWIPFSAYWDSYAGMFNDSKIAAFIQLNNTVTVATIVSGTVEVYYEEAPSIAQYITTFYQQNVQVGGASQAKQTLTGFDISSLLLDENANLTLVQVNVDQVAKISASQAVEKSFSNLMNRVETAIALVELNLNPYRRIPSGGRQVEIQLQMSAATTVGLHSMGFVISQSDQNRSAAFYESQLKPSPISAAAEAADLSA